MRLSDLCHGGLRGCLLSTTVGAGRVALAHTGALSYSRRMFSGPYVYIIFGTYIHTYADVDLIWMYIMPAEIPNLERPDLKHAIN